MNALQKALIGGICAAVAVGANVTSAHANLLSGTFTFNVETGATGGQGFSATMGSTPFGTNSFATAHFTYTGALGFDNTAAQNSGSTGDLNSAFFASVPGQVPSPYGISNYNGSGTPGSPSNANFTTLTNFLNSSGSAANYQYGSLYTIDLGTLAKGTVLTITHDDGASVYQNGVQVGTETTGPTAKITDTVELTSTADTTLYYSRQNGTPSILEVNVPEPATLAVLGAGLVGLSIARRRMAARP